MDKREKILTAVGLAMVAAWAILLSMMHC